MTDELLWPVGHAAPSNDRRAKKESSRHRAACTVGSGVKQTPWQRPQLLFSEQHGAAAQWLTSCAVGGTSSWQLMHAFSFLISPSRLLAGLTVVVIANSGHVVSSGCLKHAGKTPTYAASSIKNEEFNHSQVKNWFPFGLWIWKAFFFLNLKDCQCENVTKAQHCFNNRGWTLQITKTGAEKWGGTWTLLIRQLQTN